MLIVKAGEMNSSYAYQIHRIPSYNQRLKVTRGGQGHVHSSRFEHIQCSHLHLTHAVVEVHSKLGDQLGTLGRRIHVKGLHLLHAIERAT